MPKSPKPNDNCSLCQNPDNSRMVCCDDCEAWFHFVCVGCDQTVENEDWSCSSCKINRARQVASDVTTVPAILEDRVPRGNVEQQLIADFKKKLDHMEEKFAQQQQSYENLLKRKDKEMQKMVNDMHDQLRKRMEEKNTNAREELPMQNPSIRPNANSTAISTENQLQTVDVISRLVRQLEKLDERQTIESRRLEERLVAIESGGRANVIASTPGPDLNVDADPFQPENSSQVPTASSHELSRSQLAARHAVSKDLPTFSGNPEDWPLFIASYESTSRVCGFSEEENLLRLQRSLKGKALEAVRCRLLHPTGLDGAIRTLRTLFGRPEAIINTLILKVRDLPAPRMEKFSSLIDFGVAVQNLCATIVACGLNEHLCNVTLLQELVDRLPSTVKLNWAVHRQTLATVTLSEFSNWLENLVEAACSVTMPSTSNTASTGRAERRGRKEEIHMHLDAGAHLSARNPGTSQRAETKYARPCIACQGSCEELSVCKSFHNMTINDRWGLIKQNKVCKKCLKRHFGACEVKQPCGRDGCSYMHHRMMHSDSRYKPVKKCTITKFRSDDKIEPCNTHVGRAKQVLFRYVPVILHGRGKTIKTFAFLDDGSSATLLDHSLFEELDLEGEPHPLCLGWTGEQSRQEEGSRKLALGISGINGSRVYDLRKVHTVKNLALPRQTIVVDDLVSHYPYLQKAPLISYRDVVPRILIGIDNCYLGNALSSIEGTNDEPVATRTRLGWMVFGPCNLATAPLKVDEYHSFHVCECTEQNDVELHKAVKDYFSLDSMGIVNNVKPMLSRDDERANQLLESLTRKRGERYVTGLLWRHDNVRLPNSKSMAMKRWECLEARMKRDPVLADKLNEKIESYEQSGYIRKLSLEELTAEYPRVWYLPVFPVFNPNKPNKLRIVWDAAATVAGMSLNTFLLKGPDLLSPLTSVLYGFREFRIAITGDIKEMFHQVDINEVDQQCQRFFWRKANSNGTPDVFIMRVMTFGATCSPSCAQFIKNRNADTFKKKFPRAVEAIQRQHYVDDLLTSEETEEDAIKLVNDVRFIHKQGGFVIRNWLSNSSRVLRSADALEIAEKDLFLSSDMVTEKVLGLWWSIDSDTFTFKVSPRMNTKILNGQAVPTKRQVLSTLMTVYDPLGFVGNFLMFLKILLQEIWRSKTNWDEQIQNEQLVKWRTWTQVLPQVEKVRIPRCYRTKTSTNKENKIQLHTFVDASENGFAAVAYFRFEEAGTIECNLVGSKTRVAPLRYVSIPRLELQAAVLGVRLANDIINVHKLKPSERFFWTDSKDVLCWLNSDHRKYSQYVAVRVSELLEASDISEWNWISSKLNVADDATKWQKLPDLSPQSRWFHAPEFLWQHKTKWPASRFKLCVTNEEMRVQVLHHALVNPAIRWESFSSWRRLLRQVACVRRFINNIRNKMRKISGTIGPYTSDELQNAERCILTMVQNEAYAEEIDLLRDNKDQATTRKKSLPKNSCLYKLRPYLDDNSLIRMRGRIDACDYVEECTKRPILLPKNHPVTWLIIEGLHQRYCHVNHQTTLNQVRRRFYVPQLRATYNRIRRKCQFCKNRSAHPAAPEMADLPKMRLQPYCRPFSFVGIDYFGPMMVVVGRRSEKRWGVIFTCLTVRAIHIEVAHSLTTSSCIIAIRNFIARRGYPIRMISDRGTNFIGANRELREALIQVDQNEMMRFFNSADTEWSFNPPASPHFGGAWERLIQSVKKSLRNIQQTRTPTDEILKNLLTEIELLINSRPLTELPLDDEFDEVLTPNHFLLGSSNGSKPPVIFDDSRLALRQNWKLSQVYANQFWFKWVSEYLPNLTRATKWHAPTKPVRVGDVVIVVDNTMPRSCWPKGRVEKIFLSKDNRVRRALVRTITGLLERPAVNLAVLDVGAEDTSSYELEVPGGSVAKPDSNAPLDKTTLPCQPATLSNVDVNKTSPK